ncbi:MAG: Rrf2 family transcriptional regulator [Alcaligenaceae bacterium]|nr:Rrf2 family transcriptional regulator [Alcaligenaceae bacterium]
MRLTTYSDYALRCLIYLAVQDDRDKLVNIQDIADVYEISKNHLTKIVHQLAIIGYIDSVRGRNGGIRLAKQTKDINIGEVIRQTEIDFSIVDCFTPIDKKVFVSPPKSNKFPGEKVAIKDQIALCKISPACHLKRAFYEATQSFLSVLDQYTLADIVENEEQLKRILFK